MRKLALALAVLAVAACAELQPFAAGGASSFSNSGHPDWLRDPAHGQYPYSPKGW